MDQPTVYCTYTTTSGRVIERIPADAIWYMTHGDSYTTLHLHDKRELLTDQSLLQICETLGVFTKIDRDLAIRLSDVSHTSRDTTGDYPKLYATLRGKYKRQVELKVARRAHKLVNSAVRAGSKS